VISEDFAFFGFDETTWERLVALLVGNDPPRGVLVVVLNRAAVPVAAFHTAKGSVDASTLPSPGDLEAVCQAADARACILIRERAMEDVADYFAEPLDPDQDFVSRVMCFAHVLRELGNGSWIRVWPNPFPDLLLAAAPAAQSASDLFLPEGRSVVLGVFESGELWTAALLKRGSTGFEVLAGPQAMSEWAGPLGGAWRRDHRVLAKAVERELGPVHLGLFMERPTAERLFRARQAGDWAVAFATREVMVHPLPTYVAAGLGFDVVRGAAQLATQVFEGIEPEELSSIAEGFWRGFTDGRGLEGLLGFSPAEMLSTVVAKVSSERPPPQEPADTPTREPDDALDPDADAPDPSSRD
jgi:hypothetical protein